MNISFEEAQARPAAQPQPPAVRFLFSLALGTLAMVLGAAAWGLVGYFSDSVYMIIAVGIGMAVTAAIILPLSPIQKKIALLFLPVAVIATLLSILLGEMLYLVLFVMRDFQAPFGEAVLSVFDSLGEIVSSSDTVMSGILGLFGAVIGFFSIWGRL